MSRGNHASLEVGLLLLHGWWYTLPYSYVPSRLRCSYLDGNSERHMLEYDPKDSRILLVDPPCCLD
jgi:hypothetical protein